MARELQAETSSEKVWRITDGQGKFVKHEVELPDGTFYDMDEYVSGATPSSSSPAIAPTSHTNIGFNLTRARGHTPRRVDPLTVGLSSTIGIVGATIVNHLWR